MLRDPDEHGDDIDGVLAEAEAIHDAELGVPTDGASYRCQKNNSLHMGAYSGGSIDTADHCLFCDGPTDHQVDNGNARMFDAPEPWPDDTIAADLRKSVPRPWPRIAHAPVSPIRPVRLPIGNHLDPEFPMNGPRGSIFDMRMDIPEDMEGNSVPHNLGVYPNGGGSMFDPGPDPGPWNRWGVSREAYQRAREPMRPRRVRVIDRLMLKGAWVLELALEAMLARVALLKNELEYRVGGIRPEDMMNLRDYIEPPSLHEELGVHVRDDGYGGASEFPLIDRLMGAGIFKKSW